MTDQTQAHADLAAWYDLAKQLKPLKEQESHLRKKCITAFFPNAKVEGVNTVPLPNDFKLKATTGLSREIDEAALGAVLEQLTEANIPVDALIKYKATLVKKEYNNLTAEERQLFDQALIIKPAMPKLEVTGGIL